MGDSPPYILSAEYTETNGGRHQHLHICLHMINWERVISNVDYYHKLFGPSVKGVWEVKIQGKFAMIVLDRVDIVDVVVRVTFLFTMCITPLGVCIVSFDHLKPKLSKSIAKVMHLVMRLNFWGTVCGDMFGAYSSLHPTSLIGYSNFHTIRIPREEGWSV